ncbi:MAG: hypothetical protein C6Y22_14255 [Hapalosiphonaceae cyanobacterium JJU2]|nr:MAG: hypothetical protein C6Y22_14255 [Hapalosiphonaceae cyanobacterium JJU2]
MPRQKRSSRVLKKAQSRFLGLKAINPNLDFGNAGNLQNLTQQIQQLEAKLNTYNTALTVIDASKIDIELLEKSLSALCEKLLVAVGLEYGQDSQEYMMAGGVRTSDRIRKSRATRLKISPASPEEVPTENVEIA